MNCISALESGLFIIRLTNTLMTTATMMMTNSPIAAAGIRLPLIVKLNEFFSGTITLARRISSSQSTAVACGIKISSPLPTKTPEACCAVALKTVGDLDT